MFIPGPNLSISDPGSERFWIPNPHPHQRITVYLSQKIVFKLSEIWSGIFIPDSDLDFVPIPDSGVKKAPDPGSGSATLGGIYTNIRGKCSVNPVNCKEECM
jgi:hypothetical protein